MIDFFDKLFTQIKNKNKCLNQIKYYAILRFVIVGSVNILAPIYFILTRNKNIYSLASNCSQAKDKRRIIVSMTSFPARIDRVWLTIETILRQTQKPDKIILWLSLKQFRSLNSLPKKLLRMQERGLEIRLCEDDIRSHKKYYYTIKEYPNDIMITVDDDILYRSTMIEDLYKYSLLYPSTVIAQYCQKINWVNYKLMPYSTWLRVKGEETNSSILFFGSGGGTLFPPKSMYYDVLNKDFFTKLTPTADDIWLNAMCRLNNTKITKTNYFSHFLPIINIHSTSLESINNGNEQNDVQLNSVRIFYKSRYNTDPFFQKI